MRSSRELIAILAIFVQALSPNKFVGWAVMVVYLISTIVLNNMGFDHPLYQYGSGVGTPLSDMNGRGDFALFNSWFDLYWTAFAVVLLVIVYGLWRRGTETRLAPRLKRFPRRLAGPAGVIGLLIVIAVLMISLNFALSAAATRLESRLRRSRRTPEPHDATDTRLEPGD